jgi:DNA-binding FrmR family transcriptional regulator
MAKHMPHATHPAIGKRLKRAKGHLASVIKMIEDRPPCADIAQQLLAVGHGASSVTTGFTAIKKYL